MPVSVPPTFSPAFYGIPLGAAGTVLTSTGTTTRPHFAAGGGGGGGIGSYIDVTLASGETDNWAPAGFSSSVGRIDFTLPGGPANVTGLEAGSDAQLVILSNQDPVSNLTLNILNASSLAANQFYGSDLTFIIVPGDSAWLCYYAGTVNQWRIVS